MNDTRFKKAISDALTEEYELSIPAHNGDHVFSDKFERNMTKLIHRQKKPYYKIINTFGKRVACIIVILLAASFTTIMSVSALRTAFKNFLMNIFSDHSVVSAVQDSDDLSPTEIKSNYDITYDLSDYEIIYENQSELSRNITYQKDDMVIDYSQRVKSEYDMILNTESSQIATVDINGCEAVCYLDSNNYNHLMWDNGEYIIMISSNISKKQLIDIANSVQKVE